MSPIAPHTSRDQAGDRVGQPRQTIVYFRKGSEQMDAIGSGDSGFVEG
ncbi:MAG: hypothetical protein H6930_09515 [Rhodoferax sp.]|nr:hypothetical protein [Rhodoferax sp.]